MKVSAALPLAAALLLAAAGTALAQGKASIAECSVLLEPFKKESAAVKDAVASSGWPASSHALPACPMICARTSAPPAAGLRASASNRRAASPYCFSPTKAMAAQCSALASSPSPSAFIAISSASSGWRSARLMQAL